MTPPDSGSDVQGIRFDEPTPPPIPDHELIRCIGRGSYGEVWLARNVMGTYRAVKVVYRRTFSDARPFEREFAGLQRFEPISRSHESQLDILHMGRSDDWFYYVLELADDELTGPDIDPANYRPKTLRSAHEGQIQYTVDETLEIGLALTTALEHLHKHGLVHRDIKPSNVIFVNGQPKLADIGLVSSVDATRSFVGTEGFVPPEGPGAPTGDLYSLGKVLYELCTGRDRKDYPELPTSLAESPDRERLLELNAIIAKACRESPKDRYQSAEAMRQDLLLMQSGKSVRRMQTLERQLRFVRRAGAAVTALAVLILAGWFYQARQTRIVTGLAEEKNQLANENRERIVHLRVANGVRQMNEGNLSEALLWFTEALPLVEMDPDQSRMHRLRVQAVLDQMPRLLHALPHDTRVNQCIFSSDGRSLLTFAGSTARFWDTATGQPMDPSHDIGSGNRFGDLSHDGRHVLTWSVDGMMRVWDPADNWRELLVASNVTSCCWGPDTNSVFVCRSNQPAALIDIRNHAVHQKLVDANILATAGVFSPDGRLLALADNKQQVCFWDVGTGQRYGKTLKLQHSLALDVNGPTRFWRAPMEFDSTCQRLAIATETDPENSREAQVEVWDVETRQCVLPPTKPDHGVLQGFALDAVGAQLALITDQSEEASDHGDLELWDVQTGKLLRILAPISGSGVKFLPQKGVFACTSWLNFAQLWDPETGNHLTPPLTHSAWVLDVAASPDGQMLATASDDSLVKLWRLATTPQMQLQTTSTRGPVAALLCAEASPDEQFIATGGSDGMVRIWNSATGDLVHELGNPGGNPLVGVRWSRDGNRILALPGFFRSQPLHEPSALLWDPHSGQLVASFPTAGGMRLGALSQDGSRVAVIQPDYTASVWSAIDGRVISPQLDGGASLVCVEFSPDGNSVVAGDSKGVTHVWDASSGLECLPPLRPGGPPREVGKAVYSPDGGRILTVSQDQHGRIWDAVSGALITVFKHDGSLYLADWHPSGNRVITGGLSPGIRTWDAHTGQSLLPPMNHRLGLHTLHYSADGRLITSASFDHTVHVWDSSTGESLIPPMDADLPVREVLLLDNGERLFSVGEDGVGRFMRLDPTSLPTQSLRDYAHAVAGCDIDDFEALRKLNTQQVVECLRRVQNEHPDFFNQP